MDGGRDIQTARLARGAWAAIALLCAVPALAQDGSQADLGIAAPELRPALDGQDTPDGEPALSAEDSAIIDKALALDPNSLVNAPLKPLKLPALATGKALDLARTDRPDGSGTVIVKKPLSSEWDANVGADLGLAADSPGIYSPDNPLGAIRNDRSSGAAWATLGVPNFASVDARVDPNRDQGRVGTTFNHTRPVGDAFAVTVQSRTSLTETLSQPQTAASPTPRVWDNENVAKFSILWTGTALAAGINTTSTDPVMHNSLSAEQKIYGPLGVTTAVTDLGRASESKSVSTRLRLNW